MDKLSILGKDFAVQTFKNAVPTSCAFITKSSFENTLLFSITYDLSGVDSTKDIDELTSEELSNLIALRAKTPKITAKDIALRPFILAALNKGKDDENKMSLVDFNAKLFKDGTFGEDGLRTDEENKTFDSYVSYFSKRMLKGTRDVYCVDIPVSELTDGKVKTWKPEYSDNPVSNVVAYDISERTLPQTTMNAIARFFAAIDNNVEEEEEEK